MRNADLGVGMVLQDVAGVDPSFGLVVGIVAHRPRKILRIGKPRRAGGGEQLRYFLGIEVLLNRGDRRPILISLSVAPVPYFC